MLRGRMRSPIKIVSILFIVVALSMAMTMTTYAESAVWDGSIATEFAGGHGTSGSPHKIATAEQLAKLAYDVNNDTPYTGIYFELTDDIILNTWTDDNGNGIVDENELHNGSAGPIEWNPIGDSFGSEFEGTFDGANHSIKGIYYSDEASEEAGLFGRVKQGEIKNTHIVDGYIEGYQRVGGIAGSAISSTISNCKNDSTILGDTWVGGIAGYANNILDSSNAGNVSGISQVGGIAGRSVGDMSKSYNTGRVTSEDGQTGGIVGSAYGTTSSCYNLGAIISSGDRVGGVVGEMPTTTSDKIENCYNSGPVSSSGNRIGGILGSGYTGLTKVRYSYNSGLISGDSSNTSIGSVVGYLDSTEIYRCYYDKQVSKYAGIGEGATEDALANTIGKLTSEMTGSQIFNRSAWIESEGMYPRLSGMDTTDAAYVSAMTVILNSADIAEAVTADFILNAPTGGLWTTSNANFVDIDGTNAVLSRQSTDESVQLTAHYGTAQRVIDITVAAALVAPSVPDLVADSDSGVSNSDNLTNQMRPILTGTALPNRTLTITSSLAGDLGTTMSDTDGNWTFQPSLENPLTNGAHTIFATVSDATGSVKSEGLEIQIDNIMPEVSIENIHLSPGTGLGGAYIVGDAVTATWNNTDSGDNNTDIIDVACEFDIFGGGSESATESDGMWTANYFIKSGGIDSLNQNMTIIVRDAAGNQTTMDSISNAIVDNIAPLVTESDISISGGSGAGGAYIMSDTVTVTWDNSDLGAGSNTDIQVVKADFSAFGGSSSVVMSNDSDIWTASNTIAAGNVQSNSLNVMLSVVDDAGNVTKTSSSDIWVDNIVPSISDANIFLSGVDGPNTTYSIGDTLTATWDNTSEGDFNRDIESVSVDFSSFGGSASAAMDVESDIWTASYTLTAGNINHLPQNINITARDIAGNEMTQADTSNVVIDNIAPVVTEETIVLSGGSGAGGAYIVGDTATVHWDNSSFGDNESNLNNDIYTVTADFSDFGGASSVAMNMESEIFTAQSTIKAGHIKSDTLNVKITATDETGNATTRVAVFDSPVDTVVPVVSDANISLSGGSGLNGTYIIGDIAKATWDNSESGDNNDDIDTATIDFSAFGGSDVVSMQNSGDIWTASYVITEESTKSDALNVTVTVRDRAGNVKVASDTSSVVVDNSLPSVTESNVSILGGSGSEGTYIDGDTVIVVWNNAAEGENNSDVKSVNVDFTALGGGDSITASKISGESDIWMASYKPNSQIDSDGLIIGLNVTNISGNSKRVNIRLPHEQIYSVTFEAQGGSAVALQNAGYGDKLVKPQTPVKSGYIFEGWYLDEACTRPWHFDSDTVGFTDVVLYANWLPIIDTNLSNLSVEGYSLEPDYSPSLTQYTVNNVTGSAVQIKAEVLASQYNSVSVNSTEVTSGSAVTVDLVNGANLVKVEVTAQDNVTSKIYTLIINKLSDLANLSCFDVLGYDISPSFNPTITSYSVHVADASALNLILETEDAGSTIEAQPYTTSGSAIRIPVNVGMNTYRFKVIAENGIDEKTYSLTVERDNNNAYPDDIELIGSALNETFDASIASYTAESTVSENVGLLVSMTEYDSIKVNGNDVSANSRVEIPLAVGQNIIKIDVTAENGLDQASYTIDIIRTSSSTDSLTNHSNDSRKSHSSKERSRVTEDSVSPNQQARAMFNGETQAVGMIEEKNVSGIQTARLQVREQSIINIMNEMNQTDGQNQVELTVPEADEVTVALAANVFESMAQNDCSIELKSKDISYNIHARDMNMAAIANALNVSANDLSDIQIEIQMDKIQDQKQERIEQIAISEGYSIITSPIAFSVQAYSEGNVDKRINVDTFTGYVKKRIALQGDLQTSSVVTGVLFNSDGTLTHVPTKLVREEGVYYAEISSMTNSDYAIISNSVEVPSVRNHWSGEIVNNLASRLILDNTDGFNPESETTRGEFIAYIVKGLGIFRTGVAHEAVFTDMTIKDADVLTQAKAYGIVDGYDDGSIRAEDTLTREEAMVMLYNALESMSLLQDSEGLEVHFTDENSVSWWAKESVVRIAELGIVHGTDNRMLNPKETLTYAEALSMVFNMLEETGLIN